MSGDLVLILWGYHAFPAYGIFRTPEAKFNYLILCFVYLEGIAASLGADWILTKGDSGLTEGNLLSFHLPPNGFSLWKLKLVTLLMPIRVKGLNYFTIEMKNKRQSWDFPGGTVVKNPPANAGDMGFILGPGRSHMPWSNYARARQLLSLRYGARAHKRSYCNEKPAHRLEE